MSFAFSIVIPIRDNWDQLLVCLEHVAGQLAPPRFEVIVVDDGSTYKLPASVSSWRAPFPIKFQRQIALGVSAARNSGIADSDGDVILFLDSDVLLEADFLRTLADAVHRHPEDMAFQARLSGGNATLVERMEGLRLTATQQALLLPDGHIRYANTSAFSVRRGYLQKQPRFFDVGAVRGEDTLVLAKLVADDRLPRFAPEAKAKHRPRTQLHRYLLKHFLIGYYTSPARAALRRLGKVLMSQSKRVEMFRLIKGRATDGPSDRLASVFIGLAYFIERCGRVTASVVGMTPGRAEVLSVAVDAVRESEVLARIISASVRREGMCVTYLTAWTLVQAERDPSIQRLLRRFDICYADGMGVVLAHWLLSLRRIKKVTANNFLMRLCEELASRRVSIGIVGAEQSVVDAAHLCLVNTVPGLDVPVVSHGYLSAEDEVDLGRQLAEADPRLVFVGMGQPRQEEWVSRMRHSLPNTVFFCVGGLFDYLEGRKPTAPQIIRQWGFEWLYILVRCPRRSWRRYILGLPLLAFYIVRHALRRVVSLVRPRPDARDSE